MYKIIMEDENFHLTPPPGHEFTRPVEITPPPKKKILAMTQCCADNLFKELYVQN